MLSSHTYSSEPVPTRAAPPPPSFQSFAEAREAAARRLRDFYKRRYVEIALRIAKGPAAGGGGGGGGGARPAYSRAFPPASAGRRDDDGGGHGGELRTVDDYVQWLASPDRPPGIDPADGQLTAPRRALRKRQQVANLLLACQACLRPLLDSSRRQQDNDRAATPSSPSSPIIRVVEFCCGTGHVGLPLALLHPSIHVLLLDVSPAAIAIARARVAAAGLGHRVACRVGTVEDFLVLQQQQPPQPQPQPQPGAPFDGGGGSGDSGAFHLGIALHACGPATDLSLEAALSARAAFVLCPCCVGKIQHAPRSLVYPRSNRVRRALSSLLPPPPPESPDDNNGEEEDKRLRAEYAVLARAADVSVRSFSAVAAASEEKCDGDDDGDNGVVAQQQEHDHEQRHRHRQRQRRLCKSIVETDRCLRAAERGYATRLMLLTPRECTPKNDLLFGWPAEWGGGEEEEEGGVVVPLLEGGGALGAAEAAAFDAWFGGVGGDWEDGHGRGEEEGSGVVESH